MDWSFSFLVTTMCIALGMGFLCGGFWVLQLIIERFFTQTLPILVEVYGRIKYPEKYSD